jgi:hypothetical protein
MEMGKGNCAGRKISENRLVPFALRIAVILCAIWFGFCGKR